MGDQEFVVNLDIKILYYVFFCNIIKFNGFLHCFNFELTDGSYSVPDIQDYFKYTIKNITVTDNAPIRLEVNKIENRIIKIITRSFIMLNTLMEIVFNFHHSIQHDDASGYAF